MSSVMPNYATAQYMENKTKQNCTIIFVNTI